MAAQENSSPADKSPSRESEFPGALISDDQMTEQVLQLVARVDKRLENFQARAIQRGELMSSIVETLNERGGFQLAPEVRQLIERLAERLEAMRELLLAPTPTSTPPKPHRPR